MAEKKKVQSLTKEQIAKMAEWRDEWMRVGLSTEPANRAEAERAIHMAYEAAGKNHPRIVWCDSPLSQGLSRAIVLKMSDNSVRDSVWDSVWDSVRASVGASVRDSVWASVGASVWDSVRASVWDSVRASVWASVRASVGASVRASVWASVGASVRASVGASVRDSVRDSVWDSVGASVMDSGYGQHDANWLGFYDYLRQVCGLYEETKLLEGLTLLAKNAGWFLPHEKICWVSERHSILHRDSEGRLHCETGPALGYPDKFSIWAWHGVRVSQQVIESPESITVDQINNEVNAEVRRVMVERMGWDKFCSAAGMRLIHEDELHSNFPAIPVSDLIDAGQRLVTTYRNGFEKAQLLESTELKDFEERPLRFVRLTDPSTGRQYTIRVRHDHKRCYEAIGWTFGLSEEQYKHGKFIRQGDVFVKPLSGGPAQQFHS